MGKLQEPAIFRFQVSMASLGKALGASNPPYYYSLVEKPAPEQQPPPARRMRAQLSKRILEAAGLAPGARPAFGPPQKGQTGLAEAQAPRVAGASGPLLAVTPVADPRGHPEAPLRWQMFVPKSERPPKPGAGPPARPEESTERGQ